MRRISIVFSLSLLICAAAPAFGYIHTIEMTDFAFSPNSLEIYPGDTVRWVLVSGTHTTASLPSSPKQWNSGPLSTPGASFDVIFTQADGPGPFPYQDPDYPGSMSGSVQAAATCLATGDCNGDGVVLTVGDLVYVMRVLNGELPYPDNLYALDMNGDCVIDAGDAEIYNAYFTYGIGIFPVYPIPTCCFPATEIGACCLPGDSCSLRSESNCLTIGGTFFGIGTTCVENFCACCDAPPGDINGDGQADISDLLCYVDWAFCMFEPWLCCQPACPDLLDCNGDLNTDISDILCLVDYFFGGGSPPLPPDFCTP